MVLKSILLRKLDNCEKIYLLQIEICKAHPIHFYTGSVVIHHIHIVCKSARAVFINTISKNLIIWIYNINLKLTPCNSYYSIFLVSFLISFTPNLRPLISTLFHFSTHSLITVSLQILLFSLSAYVHLLQHLRIYDLFFSLRPL